MRRTNRLSGLVLATQALAMLATPAAASQSAMIEPQVRLEQADLDISVLWDLFRTQRITADGRVVDDANGDISHSEGQGYGMVLAARLGDRETFDRLWNWTLSELFVRGDGLAAWRWDPKAEPHVTDRNNATDGDLLIAWALAIAAKAWPDSSYGLEARTLANAIFARATVRHGKDLILLPGVDGFTAAARDDGPVVNVSYWVFPAFESLATIAPDHDWNGVVTSGLDLIARGGSGPFQLPADWLSLSQATPLPAQGFAETFGYNGIRIPLYLAAAKLGTDEELTRFSGLWSRDADLGPYEIEVSTGIPVGPMESPGFKVIAALADCAAHDTPVPQDLFQATSEHYYPAALQLLSLLTIRELYPQCL